jgi:hypothetical protein
MLTESGLISLTIIGCGVITTISRLFYKSKCSEVSICCLKFHRNIEAEIELDRKNIIEAPTSPQNKSHNMLRLPPIPPN